MCFVLFSSQLHPYVILTNVSFGALTIFHLAYLGLMFDSSQEADAVSTKLPNYQSRVAEAVSTSDSVTIIDSVTISSGNGSSIH